MCDTLTPYTFYFYNTTFFWNQTVYYMYMRILFFYENTPTEHLLLHLTRRNYYTTKTIV